MTTTVLEIVLEVWQTPIPEIAPRVIQERVRKSRCLVGEHLQDEHTARMFTPADNPALLVAYQEHLTGCTICQEREDGYGSYRS